MQKKAVVVALALFCTYFIWGSTYLAIRFAIDSFPPFLMAGLRYFLAGGLLMAWLVWRGASLPTKQQWLSAAIVGILLMSLGNGVVTYAQQTISSGLAALSIATVPLWMAVFSTLWGHHIAKREWLGLVIGLSGIVLLNLKGGLSGDPFNAFLVMMAAAIWSFGSIWSKHLKLPIGFMASATQMLMGGLVLLIMSAVWGESWPAVISTKSWLAFTYLVFFGSIIAYSAFMYLVQHVRPMLASSNTFVNPVVAFALGITFANEQVSISDYLALGIILVGVFLILTQPQTSAEKSSHKPL